MYDYRTKMHVAQIFMDLWQEIFPAQPTSKRTAMAAKVGKTYAATVIKEITDTGNLIDPDFLRIQQIQSRRKGEYLALEEEVYLLSLRAEDSSRPLLDYVTRLEAEYATRVSVSFLDKWFKTRFEFRGSLRKPNLIPLDKYKPENVARFVEFRHLLDLLFDHRKYNFLDEKHLVNSDTVANQVRANPLTGYIDNIPVSGDFRDCYNLIAVITADIQNPRPLSTLSGERTAMQLPSWPSSPVYWRGVFFAITRF
jgi:hypothetical protein